MIESFSITKMQLELLKRTARDYSYFLVGEGKLIQELTKLCANCKKS